MIEVTLLFSNCLKLCRNYFDGRLQLNNPRAMPCLTQVDFENMLHSVMMSLRFNASTFLYSDIFIYRSVLGISSVSSVTVYLNRKFLLSCCHINWKERIANAMYKPCMRSTPLWKSSCRQLAVYDMDQGWSGKSARCRSLRRSVLETMD